MWDYFIKRWLRQYFRIKKIVERKYMKSINNIRCHNIIETSKMIKNGVIFDIKNKSNITDEEFSYDCIKTIDNLIGKKPRYVREYLSQLDDQTIVCLINFCEKYILEDLCKIMKKYYAEIVIPSTKTIEDLYLMYKDPESDKVIKHDDINVKKFLKKYSWFLSN